MKNPVKPNSVKPVDVLTASYFDPTLAASKVSKSALRKFGNSTGNILSAIYGNVELIKANQQSAHTFNDDFMPEVKQISGYDADSKVSSKTPLSTYQIAPVVAYPEDEEDNSNVIRMRRS